LLRAGGRGGARVVATGAWPPPAGWPLVAVVQSPASGLSVPPLLLRAKLAPRLPAAAPPTISRHGPLSVAVFGDSVSLTLMLYMPPEPGIRFTDYSVLGCGIATGGPYRVLGKLWPDNSVCDAWPRRWLRQLRPGRPDEVLLMVGRWETMDHYYQGRWQHLGDLAYDLHLSALLSKAITLLGSTGARVVVATEPYNRGGEQPDGSLYPEDNPIRVTV